MVRRLDKSAFADDKKCIAESFRRSDDSSDGYALIHNVVETALSHLPANNDDEIVVSVENLDRFSDLEVLEGLTTLIKELRYSEVTGLFSVLQQDNKTRKDRLWLERSILQRVGLKLGQNGEQGLEHIVKFLRDVKVSREKQSWSKEKSSKSVELPRFPEGCSNVEAARIALSAIHDLPQRCLRAMLDHLLQQPYEQQQLYVVKYGGNRESMSARAAKLGEQFLDEAVQDGVSDLPRPLQNALRAMSLFLREAHEGGDDQLSGILDAVDPDTDLLHTKILFAIAQLQSIPFEELEAVYESLTKKKKYTIKHPRVYLDTVKNILRMAMYRCTSKNMPETVQEAVEMILASAPRMLKFSRLQDAAPNRKDAEIEAVLNLSSELSQLSWGWTEDQAAAMQAAADAASDEDLDDYDYSLCSTQLKSEDNPEEHRGKRKINLDDDAELESIDNDIAAVADETAVLAYVLVGRAMKEKLAGMLGPRSTNYLRSGEGVFGGSETDLPRFGGHSSDPDMVLALVKQLGSLSASVTNNIESRLEAFNSSI